jgi:hypothetical protein
MYGCGMGRRCGTEGAKCHQQRESAHLVLLKSTVSVRRETIGENNDQRRHMNETAISNLSKW